MLRSRARKALAGYTARVLVIDTFYPIFFLTTTGCMGLECLLPTFGGVHSKGGMVDMRGVTYLTRNAGFVLSTEVSLTGLYREVLWRS